MRDIQADYKRAYLEQYESFVRSGRADEAEKVAAILRDHYGHDVAEDAPERADAERPPENTAKPTPARTPAKRPTAKKTAGE